MGRIREALKEQLNQGQLSNTAKQRMKQRSNRSYRFVPIVTVLATYIALFLFLSNDATLFQEQSTAISVESANEKDLDESIVVFTNETIEQIEIGEQNVRIGEAYPMRLALEQNSGLIYSNSSLVYRDRILISKFLHYLQEAYFSKIDPVNLTEIDSIETLLQQAPAFIEQIEKENGVSYISVQHEKQNRLVSDWSLEKWILLLVGVCLIIALIVRLWRNHYRIPPIIFAIIAIVWISGLFVNNSGGIGYDETSMVQTVEANLKSSNVRLVGSPTIEAIVGHPQNRYILLTYEDGLNVLGSFTMEDGRYRLAGSEWHSGDVFTSWWSDFDGERVMAILIANNHPYSQLKLTPDAEVYEYPLKRNKATVLLFRTSAKEMGIHYE